MLKRKKMAQETKIKIESLCRTCLTKDSELYSLFDDLSGQNTLEFIVTAVTGLKISKNDGLPSTICYTCKDKAQNAYDFKKKSEEAHLSLQGIIKKEKKDRPSNSPVIAINVKTEEMPQHEHDDYSDGDSNLHLTRAPDINDIETVKKETNVQDKKLCFECTDCLLVFETANELESHKKEKCIKVEYNPPSGNYCPLCGLCFENAENLSKHMWDIHPELMSQKKRGRPKKIITNAILSKLSENGFYITAVPIKKHDCAFCKQHLNTKEELVTHMVGHRDMKVLSCMLCKKMYLEKKLFDLHTCIEDNVTNDQQNSVSPSMEANKNKLLNCLTEIPLHRLLEPSSDLDCIHLIQVCSACSAVFRTEEGLINHHDTEHPELSQRCNLCTKVFASVRSAARHRSICKKVERKHKCNTCGLQFAYEISLNKHILRLHEGQSVSVKFIDSKTKLAEKKFQCDTCNRRFCKRELLIKHTKIHMPNNGNFECEVCQKKFHNGDNLRSHKQEHEVQNDKASSNNCLCLYCGRRFSNSSNYIVHMRRHTGEKPYKCDYCGKGFPRSSDLQCHRRSHTGEKPCVCRVCGKAFSRSNKLSRHMRVHTGQRPYKCTYCEKAFSQSNDLTLHVRRHTGDRPYICDVCGDRFIQGTALQNHRRAHGHFPAAAGPPAQVSGIAYTVQNISHT